MGQTLIMLTALIIMLSLLVIVAAGEAVRGQCRRMISNPVRVAGVVDEPAAATSNA